MAEPSVLCPLNPSDYFTLVMDEEIRREGLAGSLGGFALEMTGPVDVETLRSRVDELVERFPVATARLVQAGRRFFWRPSTKPERYWFHHQCPATDDYDGFRERVLQNLMNRCEPRERMAPLEFHLLRGPENDLLFIRWIHPLCDARGVELIVRFLCCERRPGREQFGRPEMEALVPSLLRRWSWWKKAGMFVSAKRHIDHLDRHRSMVAAGPCRDGCATLRYRVRRFDPEQTAVIERQARQCVGMAGTSLYYIGCLMRAMERSAAAGEGDAYCVPFAFNLRPRNALAPLFGNHVGVLFAQAERRVVADRNRLFQHLQRTSAEAIRSGLDYAFLPVMWAGTWLSLERYGRQMRHSKQGHERSSFWFSDIGRCDMAGLRLGGARIGGLFHLCPVTSPPGLALLVCQHDGRLTLSYNFVEPAVAPGWLASVERAMAEELLNESEG